VCARPLEHLPAELFVLLNPNAGDTPHNLLSAFHLPAGKAAGLGELVRAQPNLSLLDVDAVTRRCAM
jgi:putative ABC transport system permease protein